jgi:arsenite-transporting ATPase
MEEIVLEASLNNVFDQGSLKWVFVGGKGGVGKTTCSSSIAVKLAQVRRSVLIISTDPAHNLADAFAQPFSSNPTKVHGFDNLYAMEIDPSAAQNKWIGDIPAAAAGNPMAEVQSLIQELTSSIPGIDEAMSFAELMKQVDAMEYEVIVFDTAPTGHTLRLLGIPATLEKALQKVMSLKNKFSGLFGRVQDMMGMMGGGANPIGEEMIVSKLEEAHRAVSKVNKQFMDPDATTFVCVCIPEFLSVYETERLVQELSNFKIDVRNIIINQVLIPEEEQNCKKCKARTKMQRKYIEHVYALYDLFHITILPLLDEEVRGVDNLKEFSKRLAEPIEYKF